MDRQLEKAIVYTNMARVKLIARRAGLQTSAEERSFHTIRIEKLNLAINWLHDVSQVLHSFPDVDDEVQTELPF